MQCGTSAPSELFSVAGLTVTANQNSLAPSSVDKIVFNQEKNGVRE